jgi:hypothetical protein
LAIVYLAFFGRFENVTGEDFVHELFVMDSLEWRGISVIRFKGSIDVV